MESPHLPWASIPLPPCSSSEEIFPEIHSKPKILVCCTHSRHSYLQADWRVGYTDVACLPCLSRAYLDLDVTLSSEAFHNYVNAAMVHVNRALKLVIRLFLVEDLVDSLKVCAKRGGGGTVACPKRVG